jgi:hypothetical protein
LEELQTLRGLVEGQDEVFAAVEGRLGELGGQVEALGQALREREDQLAAANARFDQVRAHVDGLIERYRAALVADLPEPARPLVTGATPEELERAAEAVRATVRALAGEARTQAAAQVPLGAPPRAALDTSGMTPREKIVLGLAAEKD